MRLFFHENITNVSKEWEIKGDIHTRLHEHKRRKKCKQKHYTFRLKLIIRRNEYEMGENKWRVQIIINTTYWKNKQNERRIVSWQSFERGVWVELIGGKFCVESCFLTVFEGLNLVNWLFNSFCRLKGSFFAFSVVFVDLKLGLCDFNGFSRFKFGLLTF